MEEIDGTAGTVVVTVERRQGLVLENTLEITVTQPDRLAGPGSGVSYDGVVHAIRGQDNPKGAERKDGTFTYRIEPAGCIPNCDSSSEREKGRIYVYLHGTVTAGDQQAAGSYASDILVEATYEEPFPIE